ncbi:Versicolorin reductase 1 [Sparassis crispa]|uniref:Versicolorin reductase 1 n=1 Tax=Sparassis crispa TaxID=139825 RepID=A0A401H5P1_9APHY|nr:Versicolorin reductase 1 [Sparassis crispa]GBE89711.1 Versicolorin reductase 1 [Sparassis crispa]
MTLPLAGKVALVTGASRGIGAAISRRLAADGANVVVNYVSNPSAAAAVVDSINAQTARGGGRAISVKADVGSTERGAHLIQETIREFGKLDILVLNAGIMGNASLTEVTEEFFDRHFQVNVKAPFFMVKAAAPLMKSGGRIILFSTSLTQNSMIAPNYLVYAATKGAVEQMTRVLSKDLGAKGLTVNAISPGPIDTDLFRTGKTEQVFNAIANMHPLKRVGQPDEVSPAVAFLARDDASWVNGQILMVNGGFTV